MPSGTSNLGKLFRHGDLWLIAAVFGTILLLILPVPPFLLDILLLLASPYRC
jgi:flagellar biosynthesis protein FlhA